MRRASPNMSNYDYDYDENQTLKRLVRSQPMNPRRISLKSMVIDGKWRYREDEHDELRLESIGIKNLVEICHEILIESSKPKEERRSKSKSPSSRPIEPFPLIKFDRYEKLSLQERKNLKQDRIFNLMTIVYQAAATDASISQLVRIWHEVEEHNRYPRKKKQESQPKISYKYAFEQLIRRPNDRIFQIALHASLIKKKHPIDLQKIRRELGFDRQEFDIESIRQSSRDFQDLINFLRERKRHITQSQLSIKAKSKHGLCANVSATKFRLVCRAIDKAGFDLSPDTDFTSDLLWSDALISMDLVSALKPHQKINHFPAMNQISRKDFFANNYEKLSYSFPNEYNFCPKTWIFPEDYNLWYSSALTRLKKDSIAYILKPIDVAKGDGIAIHCDYKQVKNMENYILQEYIPQPFLLKDYKFDLRVYVLITSCDPLRVFIFNKGLLRVCSKKYRLPTGKNENNHSIHLATYRTDNEDNWEIDDELRTLEFLLHYVREQNKDERKLWKDIQNIVLKTVFLVEPHLLTAYRTCRPGSLTSSESVCFEVLGFDILIDEHLKPWMIGVNRSPNFDAENQAEFDVKMQLLFDTFDLLRFRVDDRMKSSEIEKIESQQRLLTNLGRTTKSPIDELKETLNLLRREKKRDAFEHYHLGNFTRLFPIEDERRMGDLMNILKKSFELLSPKTNFNFKYSFDINEIDLVNQIAELENIQPKKSVEKTERIDSNPYVKPVSTQTPSDIIRETSSKVTKRNPNVLVSTGQVSRPKIESQVALPGVSACRITEKKAYSTSEERKQRAESPTTRQERRQRSNDKSQVVTQSAIIQATRRKELADRSPSIDMTKELKLTEKEIDHLHELIFKRMEKLTLHCPNRSDEQTQRMFIEMLDNWPEFQADVGRFWLAELDTDKRQSVIEIVWTNLNQIMLDICILENLVEYLPLNRNLLKLKRRLLANHGQPLWDACQDRHNSWESLFVKSTNAISSIELDCCYRFVDLCKQSLFIVYQYSRQQKYFSKN